MAAKKIGEVTVPITLTPGGIWMMGIILPVVIILGLSIALFGFEWGLFLGALVGAGMVSNGTFTVHVPDFTAVLVFDPFTKNRRVVFPGLHPKTFYEKVEKDSETDLRRVITSTGTENFPTNDPAENMEVDLTIHSRPNVNGSPQAAACNIVKFRSFEESAYEDIVRKEIREMLSAYFSDKEMEALMNSETILKAVFEGNTDNRDALEALEEMSGCDIEVIISRSQPDKETRDMKRTPARAEALRTAMGNLTNSVNKKKEADGAQMDAEMARRAALLLDPTAEYTEERIDLDVQVKGLENLENFSILGNPKDFKNRKGGTKK